MNQMIKPEIGNLQSFCRTCLGQLSLNPEGTKYHIHYTPNLVKLLTLSTNLNLKDAEKEEVFPQCVCSKCHWSLQEFQRFRTMAQDTATMLQDIVDAGTVTVKQASEIEDLEDEEDDEVEDEEEEEEALVGITDSFSLNCDTTQESQNSMLDTGAEIKIEAMFTDEPQANLSYNATGNTYGNYDAAAYISNDAKRKRISDDYGSSGSNFNNRTESHSGDSATSKEMKFVQMLAKEGKMLLNNTRSPSVNAKKRNVAEAMSKKLLEEMNISYTANQIMKKVANLKARRKRNMKKAVVVRDYERLFAKLMRAENKSNIDTEKKSNIPTEFEYEIDTSHIEDFPVKMLDATEDVFKDITTEHTLPANFTNLNLSRADKYNQALQKKVLENQNHLINMQKKICEKQERRNKLYHKKQLEILTLKRTILEAQLKALNT